MPPEFEGASVEVVVLADQIVVKCHGSSGCRSMVGGLWALDYGLWSALQATGYRLQATGYRLPATGH
jgi:hypothetical protein